MPNADKSKVIISNLISKMLGNSLDLSQNNAMTDENALISRIHDLPENLKAEVDRFVKNLSLTKGSEKKESSAIGKPRKAGSAAGKYHIAPDFDEPLEDFKEYM